MEVRKGTNLSVFLQRIKQKEEMENKKPIVLNNQEGWDFTDYIDSLIEKEEAVDLEFKVAKDGLPNSLWDTYSSFANTDGGVIVLGVKEHREQFVIEGLTKEQISQYKKDFWNQINNPDCVNENLLSDDNLYEGHYKERNLLLIYVPRANRAQRPVYRTKNPFGGHTFKRNHEGDYKCTDAEVKRMIADSDENHPRDSRILHNYTMEDIDKETLRQYRQLFANLKPSHPWLSLNDVEFLTKLEAYRKDRQSKEEGFTLAGILMFGKTESITDPECAPNYFPDYREHLEEEEDISLRWSDRICPDGTWEANLFQFYRRVYPKLTAILPKPFQIKNGIRIDETPTHIAVREAFINTLIHCDFAEEGNIVVEQWRDKYRFKNPGTMLVSKAQYYLGGDSVCRNKALQKMFMLIGFSEKAGSGVNKILKGWREANWKSPHVEESSRPDKVELTLPMVSLLPENIIIRLKEVFGEKVGSLTQDELTTLANCYSESIISNSRLQYVVPMHRSDITKMLKRLCKEGFLVSEGNGRGTKYRINEPEEKVGSSDGKVGSSEEKVGSSEGKVGSSEEKVGSSEGKVESSENNMESSGNNMESSISNMETSEKKVGGLENKIGSLNPKRLKFQELESLIISIADDYLTLDEIAEQINRTFDYLANKIIPRMLKNGTIEYLYPGVPSHPRQKYKATNKKTDKS